MLMLIAAFVIVSLANRLARRSGGPLDDPNVDGVIGSARQAWTSRVAWLQARSARDRQAVTATVP